MINNDRKTSYCWQYSETIDAVKGQLTNRLSKIPKTKFISLLDFGNFKYLTAKFPATAYELLLSSYWQYFDSTFCYVLVGRIFRQ
jgi:hypothetical protein